MAKKRTALVTGANRGLGLEACRQLAEKGFHVLLTSRDRDLGVTSARNLARQYPDVEYHQLDVGDQTRINALAKELGRDRLSLDVLINNAGIYPQHLSADTARQTLELNVYGPLHVTDALLPLIPPGTRWKSKPVILLVRSTCNLPTATTSAAVRWPPSNASAPLAPSTSAASPCRAPA